MKAIVQESYGPPDVLKLKEIAKPVAGDGDVLVRVRAASVDPGVWHFTTGLPYLVRMAGGLRKPSPRVLGWGVAGRVEAVGKHVAELQPGDDVFGMCDGAFAEYVRARADKLMTKPANLGYEQAAAVPVSATTALQALRDKGEVQPGQKVLIIGAGGGVGTFAVQIAKAFGAEVTGLCSGSKSDLVRSIGADHVIDYTREEIGAGPSRYDVILDTAGNRPLSRLRRALVPRGTLVIVGGEGGGRWFGGMGRFLRASLMSPFVRQRLRTHLAMPRKDDLRFLKELIEAGKLSPVMDRSYPLSEVSAAVRYLGEGHARGKIVVTV